MYFVLKQLFSLILPFIALVVVPLAMESSSVIVADDLFVVGVLLAAAGLIVLAVTASMLFRIGRGTLAPWNPTRKLVVSGLYSYVRNPMITGVHTALLGESLIFHSVRIFIWLIELYPKNWTTTLGGKNGYISP
jgi:protein-S-isoprenylcysteine O-methyltransferase Ste14